jgi:POT family proton-dependent oligopeptide transporter
LSPSSFIGQRVSATADALSVEERARRNGRFPPQIKYIVGNEACERFSFYGMRSILALYITSVLAKTPDQATEIIHYFIFASYFMPLLGAWLSDRVWGRYHTILWISLFYCAGHGVLAMSDLTESIDAKTWCLYAGLGLIAFGSGGIKPCVSAFVGDQFRPEQSHLLQKAYGAFYWSINFGSFFSFLIIPWVKDSYGYGWAFGIPGILMAVATFIFWLGTKHYTRVPPSRQTQSAGFLRVLWHAVTHQSERLPGQKFWDVARERFKPEEVNAAASVGPILGVFALIPAFWALFDQSTSTWVLQGAAMRPFTIFGFTVRAEQMQSANPALVMILVPILTLLVYPAVGRLATPLRRMWAGLTLAACSFLIVAWIQQRLEAGHSMSLAWQALPYLVLTAGEVLLSTTGLEFAFTEAGKQMKSTIMSFWLLTVAAGNLLVSWVTKFMGAEDTSAAVSSGRFYFYAILTFVVAGLFAVVSSFYRYRNPANAMGGAQAAS